MTQKVEKNNFVENNVLSVLGSEDSGNY